VRSRKLTRRAQNLLWTLFWIGMFFAFVQGLDKDAELAQQQAERFRAYSLQGNSSIDK